MIEFAQFASKFIDLDNHSIQQRHKIFLSLNLYSFII